MSETVAPVHQLVRSHRWLLLGYCLVLFGFSLISGRELSLHEAVLPQSAREMLADGDWVVPKKGGMPWLESPPLPQWVTVGLAAPFGRCDEVWIVRQGPVLAATVTVLIVAATVARWYGSTMGLLSGLVLATSCQFARYAWLAEDEIFLCLVVTAAVASFARIEFGSAGRNESDGQRSFCGRRPASVWALFVLLGMTNLVKGLVFGLAMALIPITLFLIGTRDWQRIRRYVWFWGWLTFLVVALAWPFAAWLRYPDVVDVWKFDLGGRLEGSYNPEPWWYYPASLLWMMAPWTLAIPAGLISIVRRAWTDRGSIERFVLGWAIGVPLVFSIPGGKHHHYLLHALAPWAVIAAIGLPRLRQQVRAWPRWIQHPAMSLLWTAAPLAVVLIVWGDRIPGPAWLPLTLAVSLPLLVPALSWSWFQSNRRWAAGSLFAFVGLLLVSGHWLAGRYVDRHRFDVAFVQEVRERQRTDAPAALLVDMDQEPLAAFLHLFYLEESARPLPNLSFAVSQEVPADEVWLLSPGDRREELEQLGTVTVLAASSNQDRDGRPVEAPLTLFRLRLDPAIPRLPTDAVRVSPMQAMGRTAGPFVTELPAPRYH